ncbi:MAG: DNA adenine methylase [Pseudomonadota bacterium]
MVNTTPSLFPELNTWTPKTQGIKYAGSKLKLLPQIISLVDGLNVKTIFDGFSGTTRVSQAFAQLGFQVISNDISEWSETLGICYLRNTKPPTYYQDLIDHLNAVKERDGWFTKNYGGLNNNGSSIQKDGSKKPWQLHNTKKLDGIREEIDSLNLPEVDKAVALTALIIAMDEVDNTLGHFTSYLRNWSARSYKRMQLRLPAIFKNNNENKVIKGDIFNTLETVSADFSYFDPPYGSNNEKMPPSRVRYASYYHIWTSIIKNDKPSVFGKANRRKDTSDVIATSVFEEFRKSSEGDFIAVKAIEKLIEKVRSKYVALSYSSGGRATAEELNKVLNSHGTLIKTIEMDYKKMSWQV